MIRKIVLTFLEFNRWCWATIMARMYRNDSRVLFELDAQRWVQGTDVRNALKLDEVALGLRLVQLLREGLIEWRRDDAAVAADNMYCGVQYRLTRFGAMLLLQFEDKEPEEIVVEHLDLRRHTRPAR